MKKIQIALLAFVVFCTSLSVAASLLISQEVPLGLPKLSGKNHEEKGASETIAILFTGDIMLDRHIATLRARYGGDYPFRELNGIVEAVKTQLQVDELDLMVANVEGPISDSSYVNPGTAMRFNFKPDTAQLLARMGFTTASMANNHALDQGAEYFQQTYDYLTAAGIGAFGHPDTPNGPYTFLRYDFEGKSIGFLGFNDAVTPLNEAGALEKIREMDPQVDFLIIGIHWGIEYEPIARESIVTLAHSFVDAGADFIWGHHPHVIQNSEVYNGAPIYYSLGNFVFDQYWSAETQKGLVVGLKLQGEELFTTEVQVDLVEGEPRSHLQ